MLKEPTFNNTVVSKYMYLIINLVIFPSFVFGVGVSFLIAPFPDYCLLYFWTKKTTISLK